MQNIYIAYPRPDNTAVMRRIVESTVGDKFFSIEFTKADGTSRKLNGRLGVEKHKKGGRDCNDANRFLTVWDVENNGYRNVNIATIRNFTVSGVTHTFIGDS